MHPVHFPPGRLFRGGSAALLGMLGLAAGAAGGPEIAAPPAEVAADLAYWPPEDCRELLSVDEPMRRFFSARVDPRADESDRLRQIVKAIVSPEGLHFTYDAEGICDAREAFRRRRGNCTSFAFLVVAVAREHGLTAQFQDFDTFQDWGRFDRFIASMGHTNVRMATYDKVYVVDPQPDLAPRQVVDTRYVVRDERAFAHFYSTAGFFRLVAGDAAGALRLMQRATEIDPKSKVVWANLGNVHLLQGNLASARTCFEQALRLDSREMTALVGLVDVLRRQGGPEELKLVDKYERRAQAYRDRNPYYHYNLAGQARAGGDWAAAEQHLRKAIRLKDDETVFHQQLVEVLRQLGRPEEARRAEAGLVRLRAKLAVPAARDER